MQRVMYEGCVKPKTEVESTEFPKLHALIMMQKIKSKRSVIFLKIE